MVTFSGYVRTLDLPHPSFSLSPHPSFPLSPPVIPAKAGIHEEYKP
jgi:hypothetical protein